MRLVTALLAFLFAASLCPAQSLSPQWEELTAGEFPKALAASRGRCLLPLVLIEKHGPSAPLGTDVLNVRHVALLAARSEYTLVFPAFYIGQIAEARHQPGTIAYSGELQMRMLRETTAEMARNGCRNRAGQRARREQRAAAVLHADAARRAARLHGLRLPAAGPRGAAGRGGPVAARRGRARRRERGGDHHGRPPQPRPPGTGLAGVGRKRSIA